MGTTRLNGLTRLQKVAVSDLVLGHDPEVVVRVRGQVLRGEHGRVRVAPAGARPTLRVVLAAVDGVAGESGAAVMLGRAPLDRDRVATRLDRLHGARGLRGRGQLPPGHHGPAQLQWHAGALGVEGTHAEVVFGALVKAVHLVLSQRWANLCNPLDFFSLNLC